MKELQESGVTKEEVEGTITRLDEDAKLPPDNFQYVRREVSIEIKHDPYDQTEFQPGEILEYEGSPTRFMVVGEDDAYLHTFIPGDPDAETRLDHARRENRQVRHPAAHHDSENEA